VVEKGQLFESKDDVTDKILERVEIPIDVEDAVNRLIDQAMYRPYYHNDMRGADDTRELGNIVKRALGIKT